MIHFRMRVALALLAAASVYGQAGTSAPVAPLTSWYAAGGAGTSPHGSPWLAWWATGTRLSEANSIWSITGTDYLRVKQQLVSTVWTSMAMQLKAFSFGALYGYLGAGAATTGGATNGVFTGGGFLAIPLNKAHTWDAFIGAADFKIGSSTPDTVRFGCGWRF